MFFDINQGKQYLRRRKNKNEVYEKELYEKEVYEKELYEGFQNDTFDDTGEVLQTVDSIAPLQSNLDSDTALIADIDIYEDDFNQKRAAYGTSYQTLINKTQAYVSSPDSSDPTKNKNVFVNRVNDSEAAVSTRVGCYKTTPSDYIGTYNDNGNRAMPIYNGNAQSSSYSDCRNQAIAGGHAYFGLQDYQGGTVSQCFLSSDLQESQSLGETANYTTGPDGKIYAGPWANAIYAVNPTPDIVGSLQLQPDVGGYIPVTQETCKLRAADLGAGSYSLQVDGSNPNNLLCYVGNNLNNAMSPGYAYNFITAFKFDTQLNANLCTLLYTGQVGLWNNWQVNIFDNSPGNDANINAYLQIDHNTPSGNGNCHITRGGAINTEDILGNYGGNCNAPYTNIEYQLKGVNSQACLFNNADGRFSTSLSCNSGYNDQLWNFIPYENNWMLHDQNSGKCLFNNSDGRFGTANCNPGYNDQLWRISYPDPNSSSTIQLQDVNSYYCLYNHDDGRFSTAPCDSGNNDQWWMLIQNGEPATSTPPQGNWSANTTQTIVSQNGYWPISANYVVGEDGADPAPGCGKQYQAWYQCGNAGAKQVYVSPEAGGQTALFDCTAENTICQQFAMYIGDNGNLYIYNTTTGVPLWQIDYGSPDAVPNPAYNAANSKFGRNFMKAGESLGVNEFIGSPSGLYHVILINDPATNLTGLQIRYCVYNCTTLSGNDSTANVVYQLNPADKGLLGYVGFVDDNNTLHQYPSEMVFTGTDYDYFGNYDSEGHDISQFTMDGVTTDDCKTQCNETENCGGFVFHNNVCFLKDAGMFPYGLRQAFPNSELYVRSRKVDGDASCPKTIDEGISAQDWVGINPGDLMGYDTLCKLGIVTEGERADFDAKTIQLMGSAAVLEDKISVLLENDMDLTNDLANRVENLKDDLGQYSSLNTKIKKTDYAIQGLNGISEDTELNMISNNYKYLLMTILALFLVGTIIKVSRK